jgi:hypothetical protein
VGYGGLLPSSLFLPNGLDLVPQLNGLQVQQHLRRRLPIVILLNHQTLSLVTSASMDPWRRNEEIQPTASRIEQDHLMWMLKIWG